MKYDLYVVTDEGLSRGKTHVEIAREAVAGGADVIQLRDKTADSASLYAAACEIAKICRGKALFFVNDRLDIALAAGADGVHVGQRDRVQLSLGLDECEVFSLGPVLNFHHVVHRRLQCLAEGVAGSAAVEQEALRRCGVERHSHQPRPL